MDAEPKAEPHQPQRIEELWFEDGSIILQAGTSQFRVHRSILAARSHVFRDMLSFPQPPDTELVDGCPLVLLPDSAADVTVFLKAIYEPEYFMPFPAQTEFYIIAGCLRLSHKYEVDYLRRRGLIHMSSAYCTTLSRWDRCTHRTSERIPPSADTYSWPPPSDISYKLHSFQLIREVDALWLLPMAFYNLSVSFSQISGDIFGVQDAPTSLSIRDQTTFINGHVIQRQSTTTDILQFLSEPLDIDGCVSPAQCFKVRLAAVDSMWEITRNCPSSPLHVWDTDEWARLHDVCDVCLDVLQTRHQIARQAFWDKLPEIYGLPPWKQLEEMKLAAIGVEWLS
ncbi:hypothetical protein B0H11DRAFT_930315 [Mycena galericulata]|nr:hypothetical protein B0H11DRAFT_930315 [Mycena galericulata]